MNAHTQPPNIYFRIISRSQWFTLYVAWLTFVQEPFEMGENIRQCSQLFTILKQLRQVVGNRLWRLDLLVIVVIVRLDVSDVICHHHHFNWFSLLPLFVFNSKVFLHFRTEFEICLCKRFVIVWLFEFCNISLRLERISSLHFCQK